MRKFFIILFLLLFCLFLYGKYIEVNNLKVHNYTIKNKNIPESFEDIKIVHFSDILYKGNEKMVKKVIKKINKQNPDIVIFSGDLLNKNYKYNKKDYELLTKYFNKIDADLFKFAIIGDNDKSHLEEYKDILYNSNFTLLNDESQLVFYKDNTPINIIGLNNGKNIEKLLEKDVEYKYTLAIVHKPDDAYLLKIYDLDTILSGHSIGGMINVPFYGGLIKYEGANTYIKGKYKIDKTNLYVSNGIGSKKFDFRMFNTPSINVYRFKQK